MTFQDWCLENTSKLNIKTVKLNWVKDFLPDYYDFKVMIEINGFTYEGFGSDKSQDLALTKAIAESIERSLLRGSIRSSNGIALHTEKTLAQENARQELIERDLFLFHYYSGIPFTRVSDEEYSIPQRILQYVQDNGDNIFLYKTRDSNFGRTYICLISNQKNWGGILSIQICTDQQKEKIINCIINAFRNYRHETNNQKFKSQINLSDFHKKKSHSFQDHQNLLMDVDYFNEKILYFFNRVDGNQTNTRQYSNEEFNFYELPFDGILDSCPAHVVQCKNSKTIPLIAGPTDLELLNKLKSMENVLDLTNTHPHPLS